MRTDFPNWCALFVYNQLKGDFLNGICICDFLFKITGKSGFNTGTAIGTGLPNTSPAGMALNLLASLAYSTKIKTSS
jgi:hypothetical protein